RRGKPSSTRCDSLADILLSERRQEGHAWMVRTSTARTPRRGRLVSSATDGQVAGTRGARVIVLFPRPAHAPPESWWRRALRWLRYGTSNIRRHAPVASAASVSGRVRMRLRG